MSETTPIVAIEVPEKDRAEFLPKHLGPGLMLIFETRVFANLDLLCTDYNGGQWKFFELSNGGFYMAPEIDGPMKLVAENGYAGEMSADAAGIVATLYAINNVMHLIGDHPMQDALDSAYYWLRYYAAEHPEVAAIMGATD